MKLSTRARVRFRLDRTWRKAGFSEKLYLAIMLPEYDEQGGEAGWANSECRVPPNGWKCSRGFGHDGPCAAYPIEQKIKLGV